MVSVLYRAGYPSGENLLTFVVAVHNHIGEKLKVSQRLGYVV
jgi:hypothetical protein